MTPELIGIITVGVALCAVVLTSVGLQFAALKWFVDRTDKRFVELEARIDKRFVEFEARINQRFEQVDKRFEQVDQRFEEVNRRFDTLEGRMLALEQRSARLEGVLDGLREALFERVGR